MTVKLVFTLLLFIPVLGFAKGQSAFETCTSKQTCTDCIRNPECAWCSQGDFHGADKQPLARCNTTIGHEGLERFKCSQESLFSPANEIIILKNEKVSEEKSSNTINKPISPQEITLKLRLGEPAYINLVYSDSADYPLDLYYLMDLTGTMSDDKENLEKLGNQLADRMKGITKKFRQGFGSFIDKVAMPYVRMTPKLLAYPCGSSNTILNCVKPYGFRNHLKLSNDTGRFSEAIKHSRLSSSIDSPEGGFDALMQAMVCKDQIGWSDDARRLVIFATDAKYHISGDGKLGGIIRPNDGQCHLNEEGEYTHSTIMDYPSIAQINYKAIDNKINIIFAVTKESIGHYALLPDNIEGAKNAELSADSSNIVDLVEQEYRRITSTVQMSDNLPKQYVKVTYFSKCVDEESGEEIQTDTCADLPIQSVLKFTAKIELTECPSNKKEWDQIYRIYRVGLSDGLDINLKMMCDCPCENPDNWITNSPKCSGAGTEKCGLCDCDDDHFGRLCECSAVDGVLIDETKACKFDNSTEVCSGRGECHCGQCVCSKRANPTEKYSGPYCECDNFSCEQYDGELCAGHGSCDCGKCSCSLGWTGNACECSTQQDTCIEPGSSEICSNQGTCLCGNCVCNGKYSGPFCEKCRHESCPNQCEEFMPCVQCKVHGSGEIDNPADCELKCFTRPITIVDVLSYDSQSDEVYCKGEDEVDQCAFYFIYGQNSDKSVYINAQRTKECPPTPPTFWIIVGIISLIVVIGLGLILFWKIYTIIQDRKEYARFNQESKNTTFGTASNPLYQNPVGIYENPTYGKTIQ